MTRLESAFKGIEGTYLSLSELDVKMKEVRMGVLGVLPPETRIRDLYEIAQDNGWVKFVEGKYILSVPK